MKPDWTQPANQYDLRIRRPGGQIEIKMLLDRPRQGIYADLEFAANWAKEDPILVNENWHVLSVTDVALQVTYLPSTLSGLGGGPYFYHRDNYVVPDRNDNPRFYDCLLEHTRRPAEQRGYSFIIDHRIHPLDIPRELRTHGLLQSDWKLVKGSIREIELEQHHYLTWQRRQDPNYYLWQEGMQERKEGLGQYLTKTQSVALLALTRAGYVLRCTPQGWVLGKVLAVPGQEIEVYHPVAGPCAAPAELLRLAGESGLSFLK